MRSVLVEADASMEKQWTILEALNWTQQRFERSGEESPRLAAQMLAAHATGLTRIDLYAQFDKPLSEQERAVLREAIQRRLEGEPLQYIIGKTGFRYLELTVRPPVLIPRPETETLVELVIEYAKAHTLQVDPLPRCSDESPSRSEESSSHSDETPIHSDETPSHSDETPIHSDKAPCRSEESPCHSERSEESSNESSTTNNTLSILDIGTGTGAVALSLLHELLGIQVTATDIDDAAVQLAQENANELGLDDPRCLRILADDFAASLVADTTQHQTFEVVVSNPPYIPTQEYESLPSEILNFESRRALDGGVEGLDAYYVIVRQAQDLLKPGGLLAVELHETALEQAATFLQGQRFEDIAIHCDLTGRQRFITAVRS